MKNRIARAECNGTPEERPVPTRPPAVVPSSLSMTDASLPPLSDDDQAALTEFLARQQVLRDLTIGCVNGSHTGAYIYGPPGVSKSFTVVGTLRELTAYWQHHQRITAKPLYLELEKHPGAVHIIDDCEQLISEKSAQTLLRSALGGERVNGRRERRVSYSVAGSHARVLNHYFYGAIIFTSNRPLSDEKPEVRAIMSRIPCISFSPPDGEIRALMRHVARKGHVGEAGTISPHECVEIVEHIIQLASELECRLDLRWIEHGYAHYLTHLESGGVVDWRDMVKFHCMATMTRFDHSSTSKLGRQAKTHVDLHLPSACEASGHNPDDLSPEEEIVVAREIMEMSGLTQEERVRLWEQRTKRSRATFYRRAKSMRGQ